LITGFGTALVRGGTLGILLGYSLVSVIFYFVMVALSEIVAYYSHMRKVLLATLRTVLELPHEVLDSHAK
jgi:amino acid permease